LKKKDVRGAGTGVVAEAGCRPGGSGPDAEYAYLPRGGWIIGWDLRKEMPWEEKGCSHSCRLIGGEGDCRTKERTFRHQKATGRGMNLVRLDVAVRTVTLFETKATPESGYQEIARRVVGPSSRTGWESGQGKLDTLDWKKKKYWPDGEETLGQCWRGVNISLKKQRGKNVLCSRQQKRVRAARKGWKKMLCKRPGIKLLA